MLGPPTPGSTTGPGVTHYHCSADRHELEGPQQLEVYIHSTSAGQYQKYIDTSNVTILTYGFWNQLAFAQFIIWFPCMAIKPCDYCLSHPAIIANVALSLRVVIIL